MLKQSTSRYAAILVFSLLLTFFLVFIIPFYLFDAHHKFGFFMWFFLLLQRLWLQEVFLFTVQLSAMPAVNV